MEEYLNSYMNLSLENKRNVLVEELNNLLDNIETLCKRKKIKFQKLKSSKYLKNRKLLLEEDYYNLIFIYITYIKEDLSLLLQ